MPAAKTRKLPRVGSGTIVSQSRSPRARQSGKKSMNGIIYLVGLVVVIVAILSFFGLR